MSTASPTSRASPRPNVVRNAGDSRARRSISELTFSQPSAKTTGRTASVDRVGQTHRRAGLDEAFRITPELCVPESEFVDGTLGIGDLHAFDLVDDPMPALVFHQDKKYEAPSSDTAPPNPCGASIGERSRSSSKNSDLTLVHPQASSS